MVVTDENHLDDLIDELPDAAADTVAVAARDAYGTQQENWEQGRTVMGTPWVPLSPETIRQKGGTRILIDSGEMKDDYGVAIDRGTATAKIGPTSQRAAELGAYHEFGVPENNLPARPIQEPTARYLSGQIDDVADRELGEAIDSLLL